MAETDEQIIDADYMFTVYSTYTPVDQDDVHAFDLAVQEVLKRDYLEYKDVTFFVKEYLIKQAKTMVTKVNK